MHGLKSSKNGNIYFYPEQNFSDTETARTELNKLPEMRKKPDPVRVVKPEPNPPARKHRSPSSSGKGWGERMVANLINRDGPECHYCGLTWEQRKEPRVNYNPNTQKYKYTFNLDTVEHVVPRSKGGSNKLRNLVLACAFCNSKMGNDMNPHILSSGEECEFCRIAQLKIG